MEKKLSDKEKISLSKNFSMTIIFALVFSFTIGIIVYFWQDSRLATLRGQYLGLQYSLQGQIASLETVNSQLQERLDHAKKEFKMTYYAADTITAEIPWQWSVYKYPEKLGIDSPTDIPTASMAQNDVVLGDANMGQIDLFFIINDAAEKLADKVRGENLGFWSKEMVGEIEANVVTFPLEEEEPTKAATGGKTYFLSLPDDYEVKTLVIKKQDQGDEKFEADFNHFINTINFSNN